MLKPCELLVDSYHLAQVTVNPGCQLYGVNTFGLFFFFTIKSLKRYELKASVNVCSNDVPKDQSFFSNFFQTLFDDNIQEHLEHGDPPWLSGLTVGR